MGGGLALVGEIRRQDHFAHLAVRGARLQPVEADLARPDAVERRKPPHQHEVHSRVRERLLDHGQIRGRLDYAQQARIAPRRVTQRTNLFFGEVVALRAATHRRQGFAQRLRELLGTRTVMLEQLVGHALRRARPDTGQHA